jgi:hypothetical protein
MVPLDTLTQTMHRAFETRIGPLTIMRFDRGR